MNRLLPTVIIVCVLLLTWMSVFFVDQRQYALVFQFREVVRVVKAPGIHFKIPLLQNVSYYDKRIQTIDAETPEQFNTSEKKNVLVDSFIKWRIVDVEQFYKSLGSNESAAMRLRGTVNNALREQFGKRMVADVISSKRDQVMVNVRDQLNRSARRDFGVEIVDVRLKRVDFPDTVSSSVYDRMRSERRTVASQLRSEGAAEAEIIRAEANREREVTLAEAYRQAQQLKGEGDGQAAVIYADSYGKNPEFYAFWRSMEAYKASFKDRHDVLIVDPGSEFFRYFKQPQPGAGK